MDALRPRLRAISLNFEPFLYSSKISSLVFIKSGLRFIGVDFEFFVFFSLKIFFIARKIKKNKGTKFVLQTFGGSSGFLGGERMACSGSRAITEVGWICFLAKSSSFLISTYSAFKFLRDYLGNYFGILRFFGNAEIFLNFTCQIIFKLFLFYSDEFYSHFYPIGTDQIQWSTRFWSKIQAQKNYPKKIFSTKNL